jgi:hypothetical protein
MQVLSTSSHLLRKFFTFWLGFESIIAGTPFERSLLKADFLYFTIRNNRQDNYSAVTSCSHPYLGIHTSPNSGRIHEVPAQMYLTKELWLGVLLDFNLISWDGVR